MQLIFADKIGVNLQKSTLSAFNFNPRLSMHRFFEFKVIPFESAPF